MYVLFDFDGTLVNSFNCVMQKALLLAEQFSFRKIQEKDIDGLRDLSSTELIRFFNIPIYKIPVLISKMREYLQQEMVSLLPVQGIHQVLEQLHDRKFTLGILTSNSVNNVEIWLDINNLHHLFSFIHTESNFFSKKSLIKKTLSKYRIDKSQAVYIGDETRDIIAAKKNHITSIGVTWGYNSQKIILKYEPTFIAQTPKDILHHLVR